jgi:hypothetical protein
MRITEQKIDAKKTPDNNLYLNGLKYELQIKNPFWMRVNVNELSPAENGWKITASKLNVQKTDIVPSDTIKNIIKSLGQEIIELGGKTPKRLVKINENNMKKVNKLNEENLKTIIKKVLKEEELANYMFFSNLQQIERQAKMLLELDPQTVNEIIENGHDWADDHITEAKTNMDQVFDFLMNETKKMQSYIEYEDLNEGRKKTGTKLCARGKAAAKAKFKVYPSAYANGYAVQVCKGKMPGSDGKKKCSPPYC